MYLFLLQKCKIEILVQDSVIWLCNYVTLLLFYLTLSSILPLRYGYGYGYGYGYVQYSSIEVVLNKYFFRWGFLPFVGFVQFRNVYIQLVNNYTASTILSGWLDQLKIRINSVQLGLAGAWTKLGNISNTILFLIQYANFSIRIFKYLWYNI